MSEELLWRRKEVIRRMLDDPLFNDAISHMRALIAMDMVTETNRDKRDDYYYEVKALDRIVSRLTTYANDVRAITKGDTTRG